MNRLLAGIEQRRAGRRHGPAADGSRPSFPPLLQGTGRRARQARAVRPRTSPSASGGATPSLWGGPGVPEIENRLGWLTVTEPMLEHARRAAALRSEVRAEGFTDAVLLGMGGSSLGPGGHPPVVRRHRRAGCGCRCSTRPHPDAVLRGPRVGRPRQDAVHRLLEVRRRRSRRSRTTAISRRCARRRTSSSPSPTPAARSASSRRDDGLRRMFLNPPDIGGRYCVLSYFGLVPAALMGVAVDALLHRAQVAEQACAHYDSSESNSGPVARRRDRRARAPGARQADVRRLRRRSRASGCGSSSWSPSRPASTGAGSCPSPTSRWATRRGLRRRPRVRLPAPRRGARRATSTRRSTRSPPPATPRSRCPTHGPTDLGRIFFFAEFAIAVAGWALEINPFDQPNVQEAKDNTNARARGRRRSSALDAAVADDDALRALLAGQRRRTTSPSSATCRHSERLDAAVAELRAAIRQPTGRATTFGYGPRFLHSTGQLHKGGPPTGRVPAARRTTPTRDVEIPGAGYAFGTLIAARPPATCRRCATTACRPSASARGRPGRSSPRTDRADQRRCSRRAD